MKTMTSNDTPEQEIERTLQSHYEAETARLRAPADLWERIEDRLEAPSGRVEQTPAWRRLFTPRQLGLASASAVVIVVLFASSGAWLLFTGGPPHFESAVTVNKRAISPSEREMIVIVDSDEGIREVPPAPLAQTRPPLAAVFLPEMKP